MSKSPKKLQSSSAVVSAEQAREVSPTSDVDAFLAKVNAMPPATQAGESGRLIFAMDATMSRQPSWDRALQIQGEMFEETAKIGGLDVQLIFFRGFGECKASKWVSDGRALAHLMSTVSCRGGHTQIEKVLRQAIEQTRQKKVQALVFVGDCMEEDVDRLCHLAGELGMLGVPAFMFHEGEEPAAQRAFREIARLTRGACCAFDASSAAQLRDLLSAVAVYAAGGQKALQDFGKNRGEVVRRLTSQLGKG